MSGCCGKGRVNWTRPVPPIMSTPQPANSVPQPKAIRGVVKAPVAQQITPPISIPDNARTQ